MNSGAGPLNRMCNGGYGKMQFILNSGTHVAAGESRAVRNAVGILRRDIRKVFQGEALERNNIVLRHDNTAEPETFTIDVAEEITVTAGDDLGFVYGLLYISEKFLGVKPFWFWMDQKFAGTDRIAVEYGRYTGERPAVKYRGWFVNDEVLIMKWDIEGDSYEPWRMVFEALLRCGGNTVIPGTDKNSKKYREIASDMGLWITQHHAEPLGAEMFVRAYPGLDPSYDEYPELFERLWEEAVIEQKDMNVIWTLGFRGQGDYPFWSDDKTGKYATDEARGKLISELIELQRQIVLKYVKDPVFCTNLYGEIMELYDAGHIELPEDIIKVSADNGYGRMTARRRDAHSPSVSSMPKKPVEHGGIYYHVSFYDLQAANHITMLQNSVDFVNSQLSEVAAKNMTDFWVINCSNIRPHVYFLDAVRKKWFGREISDTTHSEEFSKEYFGGSAAAAECLREYHNAIPAYGKAEDEHTGEQFYNENVRYMVNQYIRDRSKPTGNLSWLAGMAPLLEQAEVFSGVCESGIDKLEAYYNRCLDAAETFSGDEKELFSATVLLHARIHYFCAKGMIEFVKGLSAAISDDWKRAFLTLGGSADLYRAADNAMRAAEYGVWNGFYYNECFADVKYTAYMIEKLMGIVREIGDNSRHDLWYREAVYAPEDRKVMTLLVNDNHMTDRELYEAFKRSGTEV